MHGIADIETAQTYADFRNEMNRLALIALTLAACTNEPVATDAEIHEVTTCDDNWSGHYGVTSYASCEMPCVDLQQLGSRASCTHEGVACAAGQYIEWNGREGCCVVDKAAMTAAFAECE